MNSNTPARMVVVKKEEKELKLRALIAHAIANAPTTGLEMRVLAVSLTSPVAVAVCALRAELAAAGVAARIMLVKNLTGPEASSLVDSSVRHLADSRCHDAHELLVLGNETAWIGDSLRREPASRDSFELHAFHDRKTAHFVAQSFERIWQLALPLRPREDLPALGLAASLSALTAPADTAQAMTRH